MSDYGTDMNTYKHSVALDESKCRGCTACIKRCPTEAIRIKSGRAVINPQRCIDCGQCIRTCPHNAKKPICSSIDRMKDYKYCIALPAPALFGQFDGLDDPDYILDGLLKIGFDDVYEVAQAAEQVSGYTRLFLHNEMAAKPVISSACPAIIRLIGMRFPSLSAHIMPILPPIEVAARAARKKARELYPQLGDSDIGIFFISPCPAKASYVSNEYPGFRSEVNEVIAISDIYFMLLNVMNRGEAPQQPMTKSGKIGISWATTGGEASAIFNDKYLAADGIDNVIHVLDLIETGNMPQLEFIELNACPGGCVGGVMTVENPYIAKARLHSLRRYMPVSQNNIVGENEYIPDNYIMNAMPEYTPIGRLGGSIGESIRLMADIQRLRDELPGIDCGACGAPTCRAFAEDVVRGEARPENCVIQRIRQTEEDTGNDSD